MPLEVFFAATLPRNLGPPRQLGDELRHPVAVLLKLRRIESNSGLEEVHCVSPARVRLKPDSNGEISRTPKNDRADYPKLTGGQYQKFTVCQVTHQLRR